MIETTEIKTILIPINKALNFIMAGNSMFTFKVDKLNVRFTYKVLKTKHDENKFWVFVLTGPDNRFDYTKFGVIKKVFNQYVFERITSSRIKEDSKSFLTFVWGFKLVKRGTEAENLEIWNTGRCCKCGAKLTNPQSVEDGIGPECKRSVPFGLVL